MLAASACRKKPVLVSSEEVSSASEEIILAIPEEEQAEEAARGFLDALGKGDQESLARYSSDDAKETIARSAEQFYSIFETGDVSLSEEEVEELAALTALLNLQAVFHGYQDLSLEGQDCQYTARVDLISASQDITSDLSNALASYFTEEENQELINIFQAKQESDVKEAFIDYYHLYIELASKHLAEAIQDKGRVIQPLTLEIKKVDDVFKVTSFQ